MACAAGFSRSQRGFLRQPALAVYSDSPPLKGRLKLFISGSAGIVLQDFPSVEASSVLSPMIKVRPFGSEKIAKRSAFTPLFWAFQVLPPSTEATIAPLSPTA